MLEMDDHYHDAHKDNIPVDCKICGTLLPDSWSLNEHIKWHNSEDKRTQGNNFTKMYCGCGCFYAKGQDFQNHRAHCIEKSVCVMDDCVYQSKGKEDTGTYDATALMPKGHLSSSSSFLKQLIAATLRTSGPHSKNKNKVVIHCSHHLYPS